MKTRSGMILSGIAAAPAAPRGRSFLDLPLELRQMIYRLCLTRDADCGDTSKSHPRFADIVATPTPIIVYHHGPFSMFNSALIHRQKPYELAIQLLRVNRQIHDEAARVLYRDNKFKFQIGFHQQTNPISICGIRCLDYFNFVDNFLELAPHYLRMVKTCDLRVWLPVNTLEMDRPTYLRVLQRVSLLAEILREGHSLQSFTVALKETWEYSSAHTRHISFFQNVLEPLGTIAGIRDVRVMNVTPEFEVKLTMAMKGSEVACTLAEELYVTRMVKARGRKRRPRKIRIKKYYESRYDYDFDSDVLKEV